MKIDCSISPDLTKVKGDVSRLQSLGYDGARVAELTHDPFLPLTLAAEYSEDIDLMTSVAVAFARNPMSMAHLAHARCLWRIWRMTSTHFQRVGLSSALVLRYSPTL